MDATGKLKGTQGYQLCVFVRLFPPFISFFYVKREVFRI